MSALKWPNKDPDEIEDFICNWTARLNGDTISTSLWIVPVGITKDSDTITNNGSIVNGAITTLNQYYTTIWLEGGTEAATYSFVNRITTAGGRTYDQTIKLKVKTR